MGKSVLKENACGEIAAQTDAAIDDGFLSGVQIV